MSPPRTALVYAAGRGERMRPLTLNTPKPLLNVGGKPLIAWHLERLAAAGITDVVVNTAHLAEVFEPTLGDGARYGVRLRYSPEGAEPLETGGGLVHALPLLGERPFVVVNGDVWTDYDFARLPAEPGGLAHVVLVRKPDERPAGEFEQRVRPLALAAGGDPASDYTLAGIGVYRPQLVAGVAPGKSSIVPCLRRAIDAGALSVEVFDGEWRDVGTPERLVQLNVERAERSPRRVRADFGVDAIDAQGLVVGRNFFDGDLPLGTVFTAVLRRRHRRDDERDENVEWRAVAPVRLVVREVRVFRASIGFIPRGYGAGLRLDGEGIDAVRAMLGDRGEHEGVILEATVPVDCRGSAPTVGGEA